MRNIFIIFIFVLTVGCLPGLDSNEIIVDGEAAIFVEPDQFELSAELVSRASTQAEALAELSQAVAAINGQFPQLEGLTLLTIDMSGVELRPAFELECASQAGYGREGQCAIAGYYGQIHFSVKGAPANLSGRAVSGLSELGAENVRFTRYVVSDIAAAKEKAIAAALADARRKADALANGIGATVAGPNRIQYGDGFSDGYADYLTVNSPPIRASVRAEQSSYVPAIDLNLEPQPVGFQEKIVVAFAIE